MSDFGGNPSRETESSALALLDALRRRDDRAWSELALMYTPIMHQWLKEAKVRPSDVDDLCQEVLSIVSRKIDDFHPEGGSFGGWLRGITKMEVLKCRWQCRRRPYCRTPEQLECYAFAEAADPEPDSLRGFSRTVARVSWHFEESTWEAFWQVVVEGRRAGDVAEQLGINVNSVHQAKSRVLRRLREEFHAEVPEKQSARETSHPETPSL